MNHFLPAIFTFEIYTSPGAKAQCCSNVVEYVPKESLGEGKTMPEVLVGARLKMLYYK